MILPMNHSFVAADVRRRSALRIRRFRLLTSAATVLGFKARIFPGILTLEIACPSLIPITCGAADPLRQTTRIVAVGDSATAPRLVEGKELPVYADLLAADAKRRGRGAKMINAGVSGNTTLDARLRFGRDVLGQHPAIAIIQFGSNDSAVDVWNNPTTAANCLNEAGDGKKMKSRKPAHEKQTNRTKQCPLPLERN